ncbi:MAG: hypothetical protein A2V99_18905 [Spirochaetes bacterium RBG_16_67_19]|nr:MAG: hypothetical protein A2V99_18905 [Spirochaetes bacterium RBG_16_67_19]
MTPRRELWWILALLAAGGWLGPLAWTQEPLPEIPEDLRPEAGNLPRLPEQPLEPRYDPGGFPEDARGLLVAYREGDAFWVSMRGNPEAFLLYAQFANRQRDGVFLARNGTILDPGPDGSLREIPRGQGALKTNEVYISQVEGLLLPHVSDNQKAYRLFPLRDLYLGITLGLTGLLAEARYVHQEKYFGYAGIGVNLFGGMQAPSLAPLPYYGVPLHLGAGVQLPFLFSHWSAGADLLLGLGDADGDPSTPAPVWMPGLFVELEKRDFFGWGSRWVGFGKRGDFHEDPRPDNYHLRALFLRLGLYLDIQNRQSGWLKLDAAVGFRYNLLGPAIPGHQFKETRLIYLSDEYREQLLQQRERRRSRNGS